MLFATAFFGGGEHFHLSQSTGAQQKLHGKEPRRFHFFFSFLAAEQNGAQNRVEMKFCSYQRSTCVGRIKSEDKKQ